ERKAAARIASASMTWTSNGWPVQHRSMWMAVEQAPGLEYSFMLISQAGGGGRTGPCRCGSGARLEPLHAVERMVADRGHLVGVRPAGVGDGMGGEVARPGDDLLALAYRQGPVALRVQGDVDRAVPGVEVPQPGVGRDDGR